MDPVIVSIKVGDVRIRTTLQDLTEKCADMSAPLTVFGMHCRAIAARSISEQADPKTGKPWVPLSPLTLLRRRGSGEGAKMLYDTGRLVQSWLAAEVRTGPHEVRLGTPVVYALTHQFGRPGKQAPRHKTSGRFQKKKGGIPARPYLGFKAEDKNLLRELLKEHLARAVHVGND